MERKERFELFKRKSLELHPRGNIDLSEFVYVNNRTPSWVIDHDLRPDGTEYGKFLQTPSNHLKGQEHPDKRADKISITKRSGWEEIIEKCKKAHPNENLEYPEQKYKNLHSKIKIIDHDLRPDGTEYGEYYQEINSHIKGCGHPDKGRDRLISKLRYTTEVFIEMSKKVHGNDNFDYSEVVYKDHRTKVKITCNKTDGKGKIHGAFWATPDNFLQGKGCPKCGNHLSHAENEILEMLKQHNVKCVHCYRGIIENLEIDIYCPDLKFGIEFNGLKWHTEKYGKSKDYHLKKTLLANEKGVKLIQIFEDEWINNKLLVLNKIKHILNLEKKEVIGARKCIIKRIATEEAKTFLEKNHIQGHHPSTLYYGAYYNGGIVGVLSLKKDKEGWELTRFATEINYSFPGLADKMLKHFINDFAPRMIKTFADRRWTVNNDDNLYTKLGFNLSEIERPDYRYVVGNERKHKFGFRKQILHKKYGVPMEWTEKQMCDSLGFYRIWDCGLFKYVWTSNINTM